MCGGKNWPDSHTPSGEQLAPTHVPEVTVWVPFTQSHCTVSPTLMVVIAGLLVLLETSVKKILPVSTCLVAAVAAVAGRHTTASKKTSLLNPRDSKRIKNLPGKPKHFLAVNNSGATPKIIHECGEFCHCSAR